MLGCINQDQRRRGGDFVTNPAAEHPVKRPFRTVYLGFAAPL